MVGYPVLARGWFAYHVGVVAVGEDAGAREPWGQERLWPGGVVAVGCPGLVSVAGQAVDEADINERVGAVVPHLDAVGEDGGGVVGGGWRGPREPRKKSHFGVCIETKMLCPMATAGRKN